MDFTNWYQENYPYLSGHGLWLRGNELNTISAREWDSRPFRVLISRLSTYRDTVDSFTHTLLYQLISRIDGAFPDLAWLPPPKDAALFDRDNIPWLLGATSKRPGRDFSVIALSLSIVQEMVNIPAMLERSGIPLSHGERTADPACPLVILGGASALYTSALFCDDPLIDGVFIGEDASTISGLFKLIREGLAAGSGRAEILDRLTGVPGFFIPKHFPRTRVFHAATISGAQLLTSGPVLTDVTAVGRGHLQISEGCACFCGFCAESFVRKPYRELDADTVRSAALDAKKNMAVYDCELYSFNFSMHRNWYRIQADLAPLFPSIGLKSQRFDAIANGSIIFCSPFRFNPDGYCKTKGIKYTMRKTGEGAYRCEFSKESLKKKILAGLSLVIHPSRWVVTVTPEPKFRAEGFAQSAFDLPDPAEWVRIGMNAVFAETTGIQRTDFSL